MYYKKTILKNGLRVITVPMKETQTATVLVMVGVGSRYETEKEAGLSHFLEHMFFKGTKRRPTYLNIAEELDAIGAEFNAFTSKDATGYYVKTDTKHLGTALDVVADIYLNSKIEEKEIRKEKGTIIQEIKMYEDLPARSVGDVFENLLFGDNPLGRDVLGLEKNVKSFKRKDFIGYMNKFYIANDTVICVAGKIGEKNILAEIGKYFSKMKDGKKADFIKCSGIQRKPKIKIKAKKTDQTHLIIGNRAYDENHKDRFVLSLISVILGGNMSSRLSVEVREKRGLAYRVNTFKEAFEECGYIATQAGVDHGNLEKVIQVILKEYKKIATKKVDAKELQKAKEYIKGKSVMNLESSDEVAMFFIDQALKKKQILTSEEVFKKIDAVTTDDILRVAKDIFKTETLNLAVVGPHRLSLIHI